MYELNLDLDNRDLYKGCDVVEFEPGRFRLVTKDELAVTIVAANLLEILSKIPDPDRDELVLYGGGPEVIRMTAQSMLQHAFKKLTRYNGRQKVTIEIPQPPEHFQTEAET